MFFMLMCFFSSTGGHCQIQWLRLDFIISQIQQVMTVLCVSLVMSALFVGNPQMNHGKENNVLECTHTH